MTENTTPEYEAPRVTDHGDLVELTAGAGNNGVSDIPHPTKAQTLTPIFDSIPVGTN